MDVGVAGLHPKRPLIQYDLDDPPTASSSSVAVPPRSSFSTLPPPMKKRKQNHRNPQKHSHARFQKAPIQHWDDPGNAPVGMVYDEQEDGALPPAPVNLVAESVKVSTCTIVDNAEGEEGEYDEETVEGDGNVEEGEEESRALTHEEIWDDSALIDAWNSAEAEYEVTFSPPVYPYYLSLTSSPRPTTVHLKRGKRNPPKSPRCTSCSPPS